MTKKIKASWMSLKTWLSRNPEYRAEITPLGVALVSACCQEPQENRQFQAKISVRNVDLEKNETDTVITTFENNRLKEVKIIKKNAEISHV